jgi:hypothetical protein
VGFCRVKDSIEPEALRAEVWDKVRGFEVKTKGFIKTLALGWIDG